MNLGFGEIVVIIIVGLFVFGPSKLPGFGKAAGQALHEFQKALQGKIDEEEEHHEQEKINDQSFHK
ncbi:twin-arginine translocase TatA/TatE family subunit [Falsibacillus albus]|uniref:Twin-arginine translocase TatA/TatE family subunit n=1 Tax=Falsibacillus albus TaxID=2478915 RepID=A0A3L7K5K4_9BACI|nr:twin-arginine translocase TatA/TatE family subunit [Falsibacillus albus]RLQ97351.1 twin-arginine translocase TatA/TatE family subunit [Falsibacillus albus]